MRVCVRRPELSRSFLSPSPCEVRTLCSLCINVIMTAHTKETRGSRGVIYKDSDPSNQDGKKMKPFFCSSSKVSCSWFIDRHNPVTRKGCSFSINDIQKRLFCYFPLNQLLFKHKLNKLDQQQWQQNTKTNHLSSVLKNFKLLINSVSLIKC